MPGVKTNNFHLHKVYRKRVILYSRVIRTRRYKIVNAEAGGFEPPDRFPGQHISSVLHSTALPRLHMQAVAYIQYTEESGRTSSSTSRLFRSAQQRRASLTPDKTQSSLRFIRSVTPPMQIPYTKESFVARMFLLGQFVFICLTRLGFGYIIKK